MATQEEANLFEEQILTPVAEAKHVQVKLAGFLAMKGNYYNGDLMVVGRYVNGWRKPYICSSDLTCQSSREMWALSVFNNVTQDQGKCPMKWVTDHWGTRMHRDNDYNMKRSAFWRVIRRVTDQLQIASHSHKDWPSYLVWSNLYKLAPSSGRNPDKTLRNIQMAGCKTLLQFEIKKYRPKRLLLLTGADWATPFLNELDVRDIELAHSKYVERSGWFPLCPNTEGENKPNNADQVRFVVARHPERKPEKPWIQEVIPAFL